MKKIYLLSASVLISASIFAQSNPVNNGKAYVKKTVPFNYVTSNERLGNPDTTGVVNVTDFLPPFLPNGGNASIYGYLGGGFLFGNNVDGLNVCAQGYQNVNSIPVHIQGVLLWFGGKESDAGSSATSKVVVKAWGIQPNKAYNTNGSGTFNQTTKNWPGPASANNAPNASADILFTDIDTVNFNYVDFPVAPVYPADFAVGVDFTTLAAGDTAGLVSDRQNDAANIDYCFHFWSNKWFVTDQMFSDPAAPSLGSGGLDNDVAVWAVLTDATGVNEFFNGMKLTTYPNPSVSNVTVEYTLEKNSNNVSLEIYDQTGKKVISKNYASQAAGSYKVELETANLASGNYFYKLTANGNNFTKKFVVTK